MDTNFRSKRILLLFVVAAVGLVGAGSADLGLTGESLERSLIPRALLVRGFRSRSDTRTSARRVSYLSRSYARRLLPTE